MCPWPDACPPWHWCLRVSERPPIDGEDRFYGFIVLCFLFIHVWMHVCIYLFKSCIYLFIHLVVFYVSLTFGFTWCATWWDTTDPWDCSRPLWLQDLWIQTTWWFWSFAKPFESLAKLRWGKCPSILGHYLWDGRCKDARTVGAGKLLALWTRKGAASQLVLFLLWSKSSRHVQE